MVTGHRQNIESCRPLLIEIKNAAQELLTRLEKYKPVNPLLSPGLSFNFFQKLLKISQVEKWREMIKRASLEKEDLQQRWQGVITEGTQYSIFGSVVTVVEIDCLTGEVRIYFFN